MEWLVWYVHTAVSQQGIEEELEGAEGTLRVALVHQDRSLSKAQ